MPAGWHFLCRISQYEFAERASEENRFCTFPWLPCGVVFCGAALCKFYGISTNPRPLVFVFHWQLESAICLGNLPSLCSHPILRSILSTSLRTRSIVALRVMQTRGTHSPLRLQFPERQTTRTASAVAVNPSQPPSFIPTPHQPFIYSASPSSCCQRLSTPFLSSFTAAFVYLLLR